MRLFNATRRAVAVAARAAARFVEAADDTPTADPAAASRDNDNGWTRLSGRVGERDLMPMDQQRMQELAAYVWEANPLANRMIELPVSFLLGEGVRLEVDATDAQEWLEKFWNHPLNAMDINLVSHVRELAIFGEQCWPVIRNEVTGQVILGKVDPARITAVITDPDNDAVVIGVEARNSRGDGALRTWRVIYAAEEAELFSPATIALREAMDGDCFFFRINSLSSGVRGRSDLLAAIDHVDAHEQLMFGEVERSVVLRSVSWDVKMTGATQEQIDERARTTPAPSPLSVRFHNEAEEWELLTPTLNSADAGEATRLVRNHVLGGASIPQHWMADGGDVNLATASSMGEPTYKVFTQRQRLWRAILEDVAGYVVRSRLLALGVSDRAAEPAYRPRAIFPELTAKDIAKFSTVFGQVVMGAAQAVQANMLSIESAVRLVVTAAAPLGLEVDPLEELGKAAAELARRNEEDAFVDPPLPGIPPAGSTPASPPPGIGIDPQPRVP
ncbi:hypothetical protein ACQW02_25455 [Humitalea sp. 24SJ18S-53]|uniref:hypothetical protein n=1 Tax=Humitalea sp. 24SJ18S-53 TaxID=3422307 RepID=UPI003D67D45C